MAYDLSFGTAFFFAEGEPYDTCTLSLNEEGNPTSLWSAIEKLREDPKAWDAMCEACFPGVEPHHVASESVFDLCRETNTCADISSPVEVWIDSDGWHTVKVYE